MRAVGPTDRSKQAEMAESLIFDDTAYAATLALADIAGPSQARKQGGKNDYEATFPQHIAVRLTQPRAGLAGSRQSPLSSH